MRGDPLEQKKKKNTICERKYSKSKKRKKDRQTYSHIHTIHFRDQVARIACILRAGGSLRTFGEYYKLYSTFLSVLSQYPSLRLFPIFLTFPCDR